MERIEAIAFNAWLNSLQKKGFPRNENGSWMNVWELYDYWDTKVDKKPFIIYAEGTKK
jgi:hypothetical protein